jgi:hypothetical protein
MFSVAEPFPEDVATQGLTKLTMAFTSERRRWPREHVHWQVQFFAMDSEPVQCTTANVSTGGFYVLSDWPCKPGACLDCILSIPAYPSGRGHEMLCVQCRVEVVRLETGIVENRFGIAYRILDYRVCGTQRT